jgi:predicted DNA-binding transcriptional regulator AlpA
MNEFVLSERQVCERLGGIHRSTLRHWVANGEFPKPIRLSSKPGGKVGWLASSVDAWLRQRPEAGTRELGDTAA